MATASGAWADAGPRRWPKAVFALRSDPRFSWCMHLPPGWEQDLQDLQLLVAVHGTGRSAQAYRDAFAPYADARRWVVLAPLFPVGVLGDGNADGYKRLIEGDLRYDRLLLAMIDELGEVLGRDFPRFKLFGFSGGAHFAHRFLYVQPQRLLSVCVGAPGGITRIDAEHDYWLGTRNLGELFGVDTNLDAMRRVQIKLLVGDKDRRPLPVPPSISDQMGDIEFTRVGLSLALYENYLGHALDVTRTIIPEIAHEGLRLVPEAASLLA